MTSSSKTVRDFSSLLHLLLYYAHVLCAALKRSSRFMDEILFILDRNFPVTRGAFLFFLLSLSLSLERRVSEGK